MLAWRKSGVLAVIDQAWLSFVNLAISFAFIRFGEKQDYGSYVMLLAPIALATGVLNALVLSPTATVFPAAASDRQASILSTARTALLATALFAAVLGGVGLALFEALSDEAGLGIVAALVFGCAMAGSLAREGERSLSYARGHVRSALRADALYGVLLLGGMAWLVFDGSVTTVSVLAVSSVAGIVLLIPCLLSMPWISATRKDWKDSWSCGRWALPGTLIAWANLYSYPLVAGYFLGADAVAEINAARLFLMPAVLCVTAWSNLFRPRFSQLRGAGELATIQRVVSRSLTLAVMGLGLYVAMVATAFPWLQPLLGAKYGNLLPLVICWGAFFGLTAVRAVFMAVLMTEADGYRKLTLLGAGGMVLSMAALLSLTRLGPLWVVGVLCLIELIQVVVTANWAFAKMRTQAQVVSA